MSLENQTPPHSSNGMSQSRLAALAGFDEETNQDDRPSATPTVTKDLKDKSPVAISPKDTPTVRPPWGKPTNKAYLVLAISAIVAFLGYLAMTRMLTSPVKKQAITTNKLQEFPIPAAEVEEQTGKIKASLAIGDQVQAIKKLNSEYRQKGKAPAPPHPKTKPLKPKQTSLNRPHIVRSTPLIYPQSIPRYQPKQETLVRPSKVMEPKQETLVRPSKVIEPKPDPLVVWQQLAQVGSYGQTSVVPNNLPGTLATNQPQKQDLVKSNAGDVPALMTEEDVNAHVVKPRPKPTALNTPTVDKLAESAILSGQPLNTVKVMMTSQAPAKLVTPLSWSDNLDLENLPQLFIVLEAPLLGSDGKEVLPVGTQLVAQTNNLSDSGLVEATVTSAILNRGADSVEISLPPTAVILQGNKGMPLIAKSKSQRRERSAIDASRVLKDLLDQRYENLPDSFRGRRNKTLGSSGTLWYLPAGEPVEIFVNQTFKLNLP